VNLRKAEAWAEAGKWLEQARGVPPIVAQEVRKQAGKALAKARPYKAPIRLPRGVKTKVKRVSLPKLKKELDRVFSLFIRRRDCPLAGGWGTWPAITKFGRTWPPGGTKPTSTPLAGIATASEAGSLRRWRPTSI
jgi:hypothetical protein